jgi:DNA-binding LacI/PurR family transcriptional regulator
MTSMNDIAKLAGVSKATVSLALADHPRISEETKAKIRTIAQQLGYMQRPSSAKSDVAEPRRKAGISIGVLYVGGNQSFAQGFFRDTLMGICGEGARNHAHVVMIGMHASGEDTDTDDLYGKVMESGVEGIIVISSTPKLYGFDRLVERDFPMVFVGNRRLADRDHALHSVASDNYDGGVVATEHLLNLGHRKLAVVVGRRPLTWETDRLNGFFSALRSAGIAAGEEAVIRVTNSYDPEESGWKQLGHMGATAVFATNSLLGHMTLRHSRNIGKSVPEELSLIVFDDTAFFPLENPPVTVVKQDMEALGTLSAKMLLDLIDNPGQPARQVLLSASLVERASCASPAQVDVSN